MLEQQHTNICLFLLLYLSVYLSVCMSVCMSLFPSINTLDQTDSMFAENAALYSFHACECAARVCTIHVYGLLIDVRMRV